MVKENRTIFFSTHITSDLEKIADYIVYILKFYCIILTSVSPPVFISDPARYPIAESPLICIRFILIIRLCLCLLKIFCRTVKCSIG